MTLDRAGQLWCNKDGGEACIVLVSDSGRLGYINPEWHMLYGPFDHLECTAAVWLSEHELSSFWRRLDGQEET